MIEKRCTKVRGEGEGEGWVAVFMEERKHTVYVNKRRNELDKAINGGIITMMSKIHPGYLATISVVVVVLIVVDVVVVMVCCFVVVVVVVDRLSAGWDGQEVS